MRTIQVILTVIIFALVFLSFVIQSTSIYVLIGFLFVVDVVVSIFAKGSGNNNNGNDNNDNNNNSNVAQ